MESLVLGPLSSLQGLFTGPQKLILKRYDKLLDYCSRLERSSSFSSSLSTTASSPSLMLEEPPGPARRDYEALNALLVEELHRFNEAAFTVLTNCMVNVVALFRGLTEKVLLSSPSLHQLPVSLQHKGLLWQKEDIFLVFNTIFMCRHRYQTSLRCRTA